MVYFVNKVLKKQEDGFVLLLFFVFWNIMKLNLFLESKYERNN